MAANFAKLPELRPHLSCPWTGARGGLFKMPLTIGRYGHNRDSGDGCGLGCSHTDPGPGRRTGTIGGWGSFSPTRSSAVSVPRFDPRRSRPGIHRCAAVVWDELAPGAPVDHSWPLCPRNSVLSLAGAV